MLAFHNDPMIKEKYLNRLKKHQEMDDFRHGFYWDGFRGCAIGCTIEQTYNVHKVYQYELGIPLPLVYLQDTLFEGMSYENALAYPVKFLQSINVGANLDTVDDKIILWLLSNPEYSIMPITSGKTREILEEIISLVKREAAGESVSNSEWLKLHFEHFRLDVAAMPYSIGEPQTDVQICRAICSIITYYQHDRDMMNLMLHLAYAAVGDFVTEYLDVVADKVLEFLSAIPSVNTLTQEGQDEQD